METSDGERYEATVPDTLDLAERAEIALNGLCRTVDPEDDYMMYFHVNYNFNNFNKCFVVNV